MCLNKIVRNLSERIITASTENSAFFPLNPSFSHHTYKIGDSFLHSGLLYFQNTSIYSILPLEYLPQSLFTSPLTKILQGVSKKIESFCSVEGVIYIIFGVKSIRRWGSWAPLILHSANWLWKLTPKGVRPRSPLIWSSSWGSASLIGNFYYSLWVYRIGIKYFMHKSLIE